MSLKKIHRILLAFLMLLPILIFIAFIFLNFRNNSVDITMNSLLSDFSQYVYDNLRVFIGMTNVFHDFIRTLANFLYNSNFLSQSMLFAASPLYVVITYILCYEVLVLFLDLIFNVFRWFILFGERIVEKFLVKSEDF